MVTSSTRGVSGQRASSSRSTRAVVDLPTATDPATPMTNGVPPASRRGRWSTPRAGARRRDVHVEQPGQRQVDRSRPRPGRSGRRGRAAARSRRRSAAAGSTRRAAPGGAVELDVGRGRGQRRSDGVDRARRFCAHGSGAGRLGRLRPCAESLVTSDRQRQRRPLDVVLEGLRRLEYRGYDSAGVALVIPEGRRPPPRRPESSSTSPRGSRRTRCRSTGDRPHPLGHPRRPHRRQRPPAPRHGKSR